MGFNQKSSPVGADRRFFCETELEQYLCAYCMKELASARSFGRHPLPTSVFLEQHEIDDKGNAYIAVSRAEEPNCHRFFRIHF